MIESTSINELRPDRWQDTQLSHIANADTASLRLLWRQAFGYAAPRSLRRDMLVRAVAYRAQVNQKGDVTFGARHQTAMEVGGAVGRANAKLIRVWRGNVYEVVTVDDGFEMNGKRYRSLSAIAREITGVRWNGLTFFGVRDRPELSRRQCRD